VSIGLTALSENARGTPRAADAALYEAKAAGGDCIFEVARPRRLGGRPTRTAA
jgi:GGDEF domain-containing protein